MKKDRDDEIVWSGRWLDEIIMAVAVAACLVPAVRATRVDPMVALRDE